jgi:hypothetical protein
MHLPGRPHEVREKKAEVSDVAAHLDHGVAGLDDLLAEAERLSFSISTVVPVSLVQIAVQSEAIAGEVMTDVDVSRQPLQHWQYDSTERLVLVEHRASLLDGQTTRASMARR